MAVKTDNLPQNNIPTRANDVDFFIDVDLFGYVMSLIHIPVNFGPTQ